MIQLGGPSSARDRPNGRWADQTIGLKYWARLANFLPIMVCRALFKGKSSRSVHFNEKPHFYTKNQSLYDSLYPLFCPYR